jgi:hypothetical protein
VGFRGYTDEQLEAIVAHWAARDTTPGSLGARAKHDATEELERRRAEQLPPAG